MQSRQGCASIGKCEAMESMVHAICRVSQCLQWLHLACCPAFSFWEISFVVFKYLRCINNANGEMGLRADTEKVATLILGLFSFWPCRKQCLFNYSPKKRSLTRLGRAKALKSTTWTISNWAAIESSRRVHFGMSFVYILPSYIFSKVWFCLVS